MQRFCKVDDEITYYVSNKYGFSLRFCIFVFAKNVMYQQQKREWGAGNIRKKDSLLEESFSFAVRTGLEPVTPCVTGMYSNQLN